MTNSSPWYRFMALIEIDGLPSYKMGGFSMANCELVITRWYPHLKCVFLVYMMFSGGKQGDNLLGELGH